MIIMLPLYPTETSVVTVDKVMHVADATRHCAASLVCWIPNVIGIINQTTIASASRLGFDGPDGRQNRRPMSLTRHARRCSK